MSQHIYSSRTRSLMDRLQQPSSTTPIIMSQNNPTLTEEKQRLIESGEWLTQDSIDRFTITLFRNVHKTGSIKWKLGLQYRLRGTVGKYHRLNIPLSQARRNFVDPLNRKYPDWKDQWNYLEYAQLPSMLSKTSKLVMIGKGHEARQYKSYILPHILGAVIIELGDGDIDNITEFQVLIDVHDFKYDLKLSRKEIVQLMLIERTYDPDRNIEFRYTTEI